jgi:DNA gyrase/topoisomerase IV subunit A
MGTRKTTSSKSARKSAATAALQNRLQFDAVEKLPLRDFAEKAYLDYSMYVILDRALPNIGTA